MATLKKAQTGKVIPRSAEMQKKLPLGQQMTANMLKRDAKVANYLKEKEKNSSSNERANRVVGKTPMKSGGMLKRADGSYSKRGLWDNIRAAKGSGKKPTAAMLKQEKKIKSKTKK
jgi:hypothetical protein